jgi:TonB family protein
MKIFTATLVLLIFAVHSYAQSNSNGLKNDTLFYKYDNGFWVSWARDSAEVYSIPSKSKSRDYVEKMYYLKGGNLMSQYEMRVSTVYLPKGAINMPISLKHGKYEEWYSTGEKKTECYYSNDKLNGEYKVFYPNGTIKKVELWKKGEWVQGECFDEQGNKTQPCPYSAKAEFIGGTAELLRYVNNAIVYPQFAKERGFQGRVYVSFNVDTDGSLVDVEVARGIQWLIDNEAVRIVKNMPKWKPAMLEGNPVKMKFTMPINFILQ